MFEAEKRDGGRSRSRSGRENCHHYRHRPDHDHYDYVGSAIVPSYLLVAVIMRGRIILPLPSRPLLRELHREVG